MSDQKLTALSAITSASTDDLLYVVDDPSGTAASKKITFDNLQKSSTVVGKVAVTQPATSSTLTIADGATLSVPSNATVSGTNTGDQTNISGNAGTVTNGVYTTDAGTVFLAPNGSGASLTGITSSQVSIPTSGSPVDTTDAEDWWRHSWSTGLTDGGDITTNGGAGTVDIAANDFITRDGTSEDSPLTSYRDSGVTGLALTANEVSYVYRNYNGGTPTWQAGTALADFNGIDKVIAYVVARNGTRMNVLDVRSINVDSGRKNRRQKVEFDGYVYNGFWRSSLAASPVSGSGLSVIVGAGKYFYFDNPITHSAFNTTVAGTADANVFKYFYNRTGSWTQIADSKTINNTQYDNAGTLTALTVNRYRTDWVYTVMCANSSNCYLAVVMGNAQYTTLAGAQAAPQPTTPPPQIDGIAVLVGQIVAQEGTTTLTIQNAGSAIFTGGAASTTHNNLSGIQGGTTAEYYHLTSAEYTGTGTGAFVRAAAPSLTSSITLGIASTTVGSIVLKNATNANTLTIQSGVSAASRVYTLPTDFGAAGSVLTDAAGNGTLSWAAAGGFSWGASVTGSSGTGLTLAATSTGTALITSGAAGTVEALTVNDSSAASTIGKSITIGNTQTQALTAFKIDTGSSGVANTKAIDVIALASEGIFVNSYSGATQATATAKSGFRSGLNYNTNSSNIYFAFRADVENNAGSGYNVGIYVDNRSTEFTNATTAGVVLRQVGVDGTVLNVAGTNNCNCSTNGIVNMTLTNTQSGASVVQKIDTGSSAQGHTNYQAVGTNASTSAKAFHANMGTGYTGYLYLGSVNSVEKFAILADGRTYGTALHNNAGAVTGTANQYIASGTYTPTLTNVTNVSASTAYVCQWIRVGNVVTVSGLVDIDITTTLLATTMIMSLPIASNFSSYVQCAGTAKSYNDPTGVVHIEGDATNDTAIFNWDGQVGVANKAYSFTFTYLIV